MFKKIKMINKILVFWSLSLVAILFVENIVSGQQAYVFIDTSSTTWILTIVSTIIWVIMWFWIKWMLTKEKKEDEEF